MNRCWRIVATGVALAAMLGATAPSWAAGALAVNRCGAWGEGHDYGSMRQAEERAYANCRGEGCHIVQRVRRYCAAFAWDDNNHCGAQGWASAPSRGDAERKAASECYNQGGANCVTRAWVCDGSG